MARLVITCVEPACVVRLTYARDGSVVRRERLCWAQVPTGAQLVAEVAGRMLAARRAGLRVRVEDPVLALAGLAQFDG